MVNSLPARFGEPSTKAQRRSPSRPFSPTEHESRRSPAIDFTGYRQISTTDAIARKATAHSEWRRGRQTSALLRTSFGKGRLVPLRRTPGDAARPGHCLRVRRRLASARWARRARSRGNGEGKDPPGASLPPAHPPAAARYASAAVGDDHRHRFARRPGGDCQSRASRDGRRCVVDRHPEPAARPEPGGLYARAAGEWLAASPGAVELAADQAHSVEPPRVRAIRTDKAARGLANLAFALDEPVEGQRQDGDAENRPLFQPQDRRTAHRPWSENSSLGIQSIEGTVRLYRQRRGPGSGL